MDLWLQQIRQSFDGCHTDSRRWQRRWQRPLLRLVMERQNPDKLESLELQASSCSRRAYDSCSSHVQGTRRSSLKAGRCGPPHHPAALSSERSHTCLLRNPLWLQGRSVARNGTVRNSQRQFRSSVGATWIEMRRSRQQQAESATQKEMLRNTLIRLLCGRTRCPFSE